MGMWKKVSGEVEEWEKELWVLWDEYWIPVGAILSLSLQLLLLFTGSTRKWHPFFAAAAWMAYNAADYVATLVLGGMVQQSSQGDGNRVFSVWAPILLLHLGLPDNISAYAMEDCELWLRHGLTMSIQVLAATFVVIECIAPSSTLWILLSAALLVAGSFKYAERTLALRASSSAATLAAVRPLYQFMSVEPFLSFPVKGEPRRQPAGPELPPSPPPPPPPTGTMAEAAGPELPPPPPPSPPPTPPFSPPPPSPPRFFYIVTGEQEWYANVGGGTDSEVAFAAAAAIAAAAIAAAAATDRAAAAAGAAADRVVAAVKRAEVAAAADRAAAAAADSVVAAVKRAAADCAAVVAAADRAAAATPSFLTLEDILQTSSSDSILSSSPRLLHLCLSFSLFKLYRRRLCRLYLYEWRQLKSRHLFFKDTSPFFPNPSSHPQDVFFVLDVELRFLYDSLYKKSAGTAFTVAGVIFRVFTTILLLLSAAVLLPLLDDDLRWEDSKVKGARVVTFLLVTAGVIIEVYQVARLLLSDWTAVSLVCTHVHLLEICKRMTPATHSAVRMYRWLQCLLIRNLLRMRSNLVLRGMVYWRHPIGQSSLLPVVTPPPEPALPALQVRNPILRRLAAVRCRYRHRHPAVEYLNDGRLTDSFRHQAIQGVLHLCQRLLDKYAARNGQVDNLASLVSVDGLRTSEYREWRQPFQKVCVNIAALKGSGDTESFITSWHVATLVCEALEDEESVAVEDESYPAMNAGTQRGMDSPTSKSKILSRYAMYLLLNKTELLPCHPDIGRQVARGEAETLGDYMKKTWQYMDKTVVGNINAAIFKTLITEAEELRVRKMTEGLNVGWIWKELDTVRGNEEEDSKEVELKLETSSDLLSPAMAGLMAGKLMMLGIENKEERWDFLWEIWVEILCCMASPNSANHHLRQLTEGGQFLTHVWLLLGHMGFGSQD